MRVCSTAINKYVISKCNNTHKRRLSCTSLSLSSMEANETAPQHLPPYYLLVSHSSVNNAAPGAPSSNFSHPTIQYHYQDDSAIPLLPQHPDEHVLVLDYDPSTQDTPHVKSISRNLVVTGLKVDEAPGAAVTDGKNNHMFVIETTSDDQYVGNNNGFWSS